MAQQIVVRAPREDNLRLTDKEVVELESHLQNGGLTAIRIELAFLQLKAESSTHTSMQPGGKDLDPVSRPHQLREYIGDTRKGLYKDNGLHSIPEVALGKAVKLHLGQRDNAVFEVCGSLAYGTRLKSRRV